MQWIPSKHVLIAMAGSLALWLLVTAFLLAVFAGPVLAQETGDEVWAWSTDHGEVDGRVSFVACFQETERCVFGHGQTADKVLILSGPTTVTEAGFCILTDMAGGEPPLPPDLQAEAEARLLGLELCVRGIGEGMIRTESGLILFSDPELTDQLKGAPATPWTAPNTSRT
jgi:hypothetical protein